MDIRFFTDTKINAGFTTRELASDVRMAHFLRMYPYVARARLVHGCEIAQITKKTFRKAYYEMIPETDGLITDVRGALLVTTHGDCLPIYAYDPVRKAVGLAHAGWRGTAAGIAAKLIEAMRNAYGCKSSDIRTAIGPGICASCFEVGEEVAAQFTDAFPWSEDLICAKDNGKFTIDLKAVNAQLLENEGVADVEISPRCTCCEPESFFSYRRDKTAERMLAYIAI